VLIDVQYKVVDDLFCQNRLVHLDQFVLGDHRVDGHVVFVFFILIFLLFLLFSEGPQLVYLLVDLIMPLLSCIVLVVMFGGFAEIMKSIGHRLPRLSVVWVLHTNLHLLLAEQESTTQGR